MLSVDYKMFAIILATTAATLWGSLGLGQAQLLDEDDDLAFGRPWPTYSLQNMPKTQFTCHDKILGGYYADPDTQCQMFHVCVKLPGIGLLHRRANPFVQQVQDYRFLCPNTTAFDQELQICANWADVDCDKATSFYDNNNLNDLYRDGDSKGANEEEATFHLQRAETGDVRRSKENSRGGEQKSRPRHNYASSSSSSSPNLEITQPTKRPISSYYTPTTSSSTSTTSTTTTSTTERSYYNNNYGNNNDDSKQDFDDIFKGSHSSHFFSNRQGGREYDEESSAGVRSKPNDFSDYNRKTTEASSKSRVTPTRGQRPTSSTAPSTAAPSTTKSVKKITLHASFNTDFLDYTPQARSTTTPRPSSSITSRFSFGVNDYQTQERIQPTTYNPNSGAYRFKSTPPPKYTEQPSSSTKLTGKNVQDFDKETTKRNKPTVAARKQKLGPQESNYINHNEFVDIPKSKVQQPQPFQATQNKLEPHYQRPKPQQLSRVGTQEPAPFKASASSGPSAKPRSFTSRGSITYKATTQRYADDELLFPSTAASTSASAAVKKVTHAAKDSFTPTTFKPTTYKKLYEQNFYQAQQTQRPSQSTTKKAATVAGALPTTANPYYNVDEDDGQYHPELYENDFPRNRFKFLRTRSSSSTSTTTPSAPPSSRQPHGFSHNFQQAHSHLKSQQQSAYQKEKERESDLSDEDELFKTAQSLNFGAASINKLRADIYKAEKTSQQYNSQYSPQITPSSPKTTAQTTSRPTTYSSSSTTQLTSTTTTSTTRRPTPSTTKTTTTSTTSAPVEAKKSARSKKEKQLDKKDRPAGKRQRPPYADEDTSYDYAYYDTD
ncbi:mucin-5AC isoform X2 [Drosophila pseudoobscura]|uniref:Mucin-5AC isoform X2 n=1 Tax=Drosophila pseudoobscura pseudoobscura TaxID=46245 RepID=A0A6I8VAE9_DROPS|nr:mucin-5AC isoform X2 [Drosophila pseudoobscura]